MPTRRLLPQRRLAETFDLEWGGMRIPHTVTIGKYPDGAIGEIFITSGKSGEQVESVARDGAILASICLQYGAPISVLASAITRDPRGHPQTIVGAVLDALLNRET